MVGELVAHEVEDAGPVEASEAAAESGDRNPKPWSTQCGICETLEALADELVGRGLTPVVLRRNADHVEAMLLVEEVALATAVKDGDRVNLVLGARHAPEAAAVLVRCEPLRPARCGCFGKTGAGRGACVDGNTEGLDIDLEDVAARGLQLKHRRGRIGPRTRIALDCQVRRLISGVL